MRYCPCVWIYCLPPASKGNIALPTMCHSMSKTARTTAAQPWGWDVQEQEKPDQFYATSTTHLGVHPVPWPGHLCSDGNAGGMRLVGPLEPAAGFSFRLMLPPFCRGLHRLHGSLGSCAVARYKVGRNRPCEINHHHNMPSLVTQTLQHQSYQDQAR